MTINKVQDNGARATSGALAVTLGSTPVMDNLLIACWGWNGAPSTFPVPAGWGLAKQWAGPSGLSAIWFKVAGASESPTLSVTPATGNQYDLHLAEFSGLSATPALDKTAKADSSTTSVLTLTSESTGPLVGIGDLIIACLMNNATITTPAWGSGMNSIRSTSRLVSGWGVDADQTAKTPQVDWASTAGRAVMSTATFSPTALTPTGFEGWGQPA